MKYLDLTFADPARNLACDEALVDLCEAIKEGEILRVWEPDCYFVVVGYSNKVAVEVDVAGCKARGLPIFRRFSGGGAVLQGPGCLNYTLVIKNTRAGSLSDVAAGFNYVLRKHQGLCKRLVKEEVHIQGISDLAIGGQKFSGNAQHRKHFYTVFHGTFLLNFDLSRIETCLPMPSRQPPYRNGRSHREFLRNLLIDSVGVREGLKVAWRVDQETRKVPVRRIDELVFQRYSKTEWNYKF
jgi:lipoate---protein ligase